MFPELVQQYSAQIQTFYYLILAINAILHLIFAGAVARDAGNLYKLGQKTALVSGHTWAFATLVGGIIPATIYWFIHHSTLTRPNLRETRYENA
jgi:ATP/ADP translocase